MSYQKPNFRHPKEKPNKAGYFLKDYEGLPSTLCAGCGHDSITNAIIQACFEMSLEPHRVAKISGIGCSSKTPAYFLNKSHGFNSVHGRMPSVATGANMANRDLTYIGVSGDGDTASIGFGQFAHVIRRNLNLNYFVMNNGCYALTKGQDSATTDKGSTSRKGAPNPYPAIDLCELAISLGAGFVARGFAGDREQLSDLMKAAIGYKGLAFIDIISPCVTFNNTESSTKSFGHVREHSEPDNDIDFIPAMTEITSEQREGTDKIISLHDGSKICLYKSKSDRQIDDTRLAIETLQRKKEEGKILTGLIYLNTESLDTHGIINTCTKPLNSLAEEQLCPGQEVLNVVNSSFR
ncbi:MAG: 2-oxoacid:ferredoxin oxidoreductase subunit beta [Desulfotalea sp.]